MTPARVGLRVALFVALCAGLFWDVGGDKMWRASEERCLKVVQEMVRSGDWLVPRLDGEPRLQKPPLFYWAGAVSATLGGGANLTTLRCVSGLAALALALAVWLAGRAWGGDRGADLCVLALAACALFWVRGRVGDAEMLLALLVFASLAVAERLWHSRDAPLLAAVSVLLGLAFLAKATAALLCFFAPVVAWLALERQLGLLVRPLVLAWLAVALAIGLSWYAEILWRVPGAGELFRSYLVAPAGVQAGTNATHLRGLLYYATRFPVQLLPAAVLLPWLAWDGWRRRFWREQPGVRFWAVACLANVVGWTLVPSKQIHYLLPAVPMYAMWAGRALDARWIARG
ncbi:MAG TPA: glycosyltransferase family 39 protein [Myxococcota bacterium]|nr:glycosyltransferase family 39 protein [Myxococcota bacterium]